MVVDVGFVQKGQGDCKVDGLIFLCSDVLVVVVRVCLDVR